jgi:uncharacterized protein
MLLSNGTINFTSDDIVCLFNKYTLKKYYLKKSEFDNPSTELIRELEKLKLVNASIDLSEYVKRMSGVRFSVAYLLLTDNCNLNCKYCFIESCFEKHNNSMSLETAFKAIDLYKKLVEKSGVDLKYAQVIFYGGEPTLNRKVLMPAIKRVRGYGMKPHMVTNGTLMDEELAVFLAENEVEVGVSMDGPKEVHDLKRVDLEGGGSFEKALNCFKLLKECGVRVGVSCTISNHNIDEAAELTYFFNQIGCKNYTFNFLNYNSNDSVPIEKLSEFFIKAFNLSKIFDAVEGRALRCVKAFINEDLNFKDCAGLGNQIVVLPDGKVGVCQAYASSEKYFIKTVDDDPESFFADSVFKKWSERFPLNINNCLNCNAIGICGGGCAYYAEQTKGKIEEVDERYCKIMNDFLEFLIWDYYQKIHPFEETVVLEGVEIKIREIRLDDQPKILPFFIKLKPDAPYFRTDGMIKAQKMNILFAEIMVNSKNQNYCLVAERENEIVGFCNFCTPNGGFKEDMSHNLGIAILNNFRGKGLGLELMKQTVKEARRKKFSIRFDTRVENIPMQKLAEKAGFKFEGIDKDHKIYFLE